MGVKLGLSRGGTIIG